MFGSAEAWSQVRVGKTAKVRVKRVDSDVQMIRAYGAHERISVKRAGAEGDKR